MSITIYHNPRCQKSRQALEQLKAENCELNIVEYLKDTPTKAQLKQLIKLLGIAPIQLIRTNETAFAPYRNQKLTATHCVDLMLQFPQLIQRPIVVNGQKAIIGRPPELVLDLIKS